LTLLKFFCFQKLQYHNTDTIPSSDDFVKRKEVKTIPFIECDLSSLYDPIYNDLSGKEILGNCDDKTILKKLGLKSPTLIKRPTF
jgi:hypothetical protein